jgi:hypothetical protein
MKIQLLDDSLLPEGFKYPIALKRLIELNLVDFECYYFMDKSSATIRIDGLKQRYPDRVLIPFAQRKDNDDIACFELHKNGVQIIHDYASPGWEQRQCFNDFWSWLYFVVDEMIENEIMEEEYEISTGVVLIYGKELLEKNILPEGFAYPYGLRCISELELVNFDIWYLLDKINTTVLIDGLKERYPERMLIPFAKRSDNGDIACFELNKNGVQIIHDFMSFGSEQGKLNDTFWDWFKDAIEEMIKSVNLKQNIEEHKG